MSRSIIVAHAFSRRDNAIPARHSIRVYYLSRTGKAGTVAENTPFDVLPLDRGGTGQSRVCFRRREVTVRIGPNGFLYHLHGGGVTEYNDP